MIKRLFFMFVAVLFVFSLMGREAGALELLNGDLKIKGFLMNQTGLRMNDVETGLHGLDIPGGKTGQKGETGDLFMFRNTLELELSYKITDKASAYGLYRFVYDGAFDVNDDYKNNLRRAGAGYRIESIKTDNSFREAFLDIDLANSVHLRIGKQQIVWGESDGLRMSDIINPLDLSWHYIYAAWEDIRIPMWGLDLSWAIPCAPHNDVLELVFFPGCIDNGWQPRKLGDAGTQYHNPGYAQWLLQDVRSSIPNKNIRNASEGLRWRSSYGGLDMAVFYYYARYDAPTFREDWLQRLGAGDHKLFRYPHVHQIGGSFNYSEQKFTDSVLRAEWLYRVDEPFNPKADLFGSLPGGRTPIYERDTIQYMIGFDRPTMISFLNPGRTFFVSMQLFQRYILNHTDKLAPGDLPGNDSYQTFASLCVNTGYLNDKLFPQLFTFVNLDGSAWLQYQVEYIWRTNWRFGIAYNQMVSHDKKEVYFGTMRDEDDLTFTVKWNF